MSAFRNVKVYYRPEAFKIKMDARAKIWLPKFEGALVDGEGFRSSPKAICPTLKPNDRKLFCVSATC